MTTTKRSVLATRSALPTLFLFHLAFSEGLWGEWTSFQSAILFSFKKKHNHEHLPTFVIHIPHYQRSCHPPASNICLAA